MANKRGPKSMTDEHKAALEAGRAEGRAVREYLDAVRNNRPKRGRKRTPETITTRLAEIEAAIQHANALAELLLIQERRDLDAELAAMRVEVDLTELEDAFVKVARAYGDRKGIAYASWREVGVPASALKRAGITRSTGA